MSLLFFAKTFCVFVFVVCAFCEAAHAAGTDETVKKINIFNSGEIQKIIPTDGDESQATNNNIEVESFYSPVLLSTNDVMIAVIGGKRNGKPEANIDILTRYIETADEKIKNAFATKTIDTNWKTQFALKEDNQKKVLKNFAATAKGDKIYILLVDQSTTLLKGKEWVFSVVEGAVTKKVKTTQITWGKSQLSDLSIYSKFKKDVSDNYPQFLSAFVTSNDNVVFFVKGKLQESGKNVFALIKSEASKTVSEVVSIADDIDDACNPNFFLWESKVIMIPTSCKEGTGPKIKQFDFKNEGFVESEEFNNRVWDFLKDKKDITTATINTTPAVLFTQEAPAGKKEIFLWMTDGSRLYKVRSAVPNDGEQSTVAGLLYTKEKLFCLLLQTGQESIILSHLQKQQEEIKNALETWKGSDDKVQKFCAATTFSKTACTTDGLVGFLYGKLENKKNQWKDNYLSVDATVDGSREKINEDNIMFSGADARAVWPVNKDNGEQPYSFTNSGFTLVATLTITKNEEGIDNSLLGLVVKGENKRFGVRCTADGKWGVKVGNGEEGVKSSDVACEPDTLYFVGLILSDRKLSVYVDGNELTKLNNGEMTIKPSENIDHFYFGADTQSKTKTDVTITNVLLYNRPLPPEEIEKFKPKQIKREIVKREAGSDSTTKQEPKGSTTEADNSPGTSATKSEKEVQPSSPPPTTKDSAARVGVGVLCFMLFGVFTLLGRYVY